MKNRGASTGTTHRHHGQDPGAPLRPPTTAESGVTNPHDALHAPAGAHGEGGHTAEPHVHETAAHGEAHHADSSAVTPQHVEESLHALGQHAGPVPHEAGALPAIESASAANRAVPSLHELRSRHMPVLHPYMCSAFRALTLPRRAALQHHLEEHVGQRIDWQGFGIPDDTTFVLVSNERAYKHHLNRAAQEVSKSVLEGIAFDCTHRYRDDRRRHEALRAIHAVGVWKFFFEASPNDEAHE